MFMIRRIHIVMPLILAFSSLPSMGDHVIQKEPYQVIKVLRENKKYFNYGKIQRFPGNRHVDEFYQADELLPEGEQGEIYTVWIKCRQPGTLLVVFSCYRENENEPVRQETTINAVRKGTYRVQFDNTGPVFHKGGHICCWNIQIMNGEVLVAVKRSKLWPS